MKNLCRQHQAAGEAREDSAEDDDNGRPEPKPDLYLHLNLIKPCAGSIWRRVRRGRTARRTMTKADLNLNQIYIYT